MNNKLTPHFTVQEMERSSTAIRKGLDNTCPPELLGNMKAVAMVLEIIRAHFKSPVHVTSCYRSLAVNKAVGGSQTSAHVYACAADFTVQGVPNIDVCRWIAANIKGFDQVIYEFGPSGWVHLGLSRDKPRMQQLTAIKKGRKTIYRSGLID